ncbi:MAG: MarR family transcriptional regulator [Clostridia bacterium]|nr:MarR family transcriptional regulator [Clostridia bacterium]
MEERFETFTVQIARISRCIRKIKTEEMEEFDLKSPHVSCLYYLYKSDGLTAKELCDVCEEDKGAVSRSVEYLEKNGYLHCDCMMKKRYKSRLYLTEKGWRVGAKITEKIDRILSEASEGLTEENRLVFYRSLSLIAENLKKICNQYGE